MKTYRSNFLRKKLGKRQKRKHGMGNVCELAVAELQANDWKSRNLWKKKTANEEKALEDFENALLH